jgi:SWI/SNF-related matrix-associated actin-dependent regulator 1 of chromatin subfamily A
VVIAAHSKRVEMSEQREGDEDLEALEAACRAAEEQRAQAKQVKPTEAIGSVQVSRCGKIALNLGGWCPKPVGDALRATGRFQKDARTGCWLVAMHELETALADAQRHARLRNASLSVHQPHPIARRAVHAGLCTDYSSRLERVSCLDHLFPFQRDGVSFALRRSGRALIADEMGCGKTVQALAIAEAFSEDWPALVLVPNIVRDVWSKTASEWLSWLSPDDICAVRTKNDHVSNTRLVIVPYSRLASMQEQLLQHNFKIVIADESHYLKDGNTKRAKAAHAIAKKARRVLLLSGTPALSRPWELYSQVSMIRPDVFNSYRSYVERYCGNAQFPTKGCSNTEELHGLLSWLLMIRRMKRDVLGQLPEKIREQIYVPIDEGDAAGMDKLKQLSKQAGEKATTMESCSDSKQIASLRREHDQLLTKLYVETAEVKREPVKNHLKMLIESGTHFIFFAHHRCLLDAAQQAVKEVKSSCIRIDGSTGNLSRQEQVESFEKSGSNVPQVAILSISAAGTGVSFTSTSHVVFGEMTWTPAELQQAEDRVHRIGQNAASITIQFLHLKDSIDDVLWKTISSKLANMGQVLNGRAENINVSSREAQNTKTQKKGPDSGWNHGRDAEATPNSLEGWQAVQQQSSRKNTIERMFERAGKNKKHQRSGEERDGAEQSEGERGKRKAEKVIAPDGTEQHRRKENMGRQGWPTIEGWGAEWTEGSNPVLRDLISECETTIG